MAMYGLRLYKFGIYTEFEVNYKLIINCQKLYYYKF